MKFTKFTQRWDRGLRLAAATLVIVVSGFGATASAANAGNGLRVSPVRTDVTINPGTSQTVSINVTNVTGAAATFQAIFNDFIANPDESGNPAIILDPTKYAPSHSLKRFVAPIQSVTLQPGEQKAVSVVITVPSNAAGGGYYGAVRFAPANTANPPGKQVSLSGSVGSLILVKVPGNIKEQLSVAGFDVESGAHASNFFTTSKNLTVNVRLQNEGNIQDAPFGKILLKNRSGKTLGTYELNNINPPGNVLPDSIRRFVVPITAGKFGEFKLEGNFGYGTSGQLLSASTTFYVVPISIIITFIVVVLILAFLIFGLPRLIRAYNRRIIRRAGKRS
jgi:hypothetical protein